jgi:hypothetical protein
MMKKKKKKKKKVNGALPARKRVFVFNVDVEMHGGGRGSLKKLIIRCYTSIFL